MKTSLHHYFSQLPDPRIQRNKKHLLIDIVVLSVIAVICGAESWNSVEIFGNSKKDFLATILKLPNGYNHFLDKKMSRILLLDKALILWMRLWIRDMAGLKTIARVTATREMNGKQTIDGLLGS